MDPYLEEPNHWPSVHTTIVTECQAALNAVIRPKYAARAEIRVYVLPEDDPLQSTFRIPDHRIVRERRAARTQSRGTETATATVASPIEMVTVAMAHEVREYFLTVRDSAGKRVVTVIELLSPSNKMAGSVGRKEFLDKRLKVMHSRANWVEIDLLRGGRRMPRIEAVAAPYHVHVSPAHKRPRGMIWPIQLRDRLPVIEIPLGQPSESAALDLQTVLANAFERGAFDSSINYAKDADPPLVGADADWANELLRAAGQRSRRKRR